jgi:L-ascorbate metabolism protein UlaG (beta-lactamase superfamily)
LSSIKSILQEQPKELMAGMETNLTLVGGPTILIEISRARLLTDPTFDPPSQYESKGIVLTKKTSPAISADAIGHVDAVLLSHDQHFDNFDHAGREFLTKAKSTFTTKVGAERLGHIATGLSPWETASLKTQSGQSIHVTSTPARHGPPGIEPIAGDVTGFLIGIDKPGDTIYITGDTVWYEGVAEVAKRFQPRLVILFTGSAKPRGAFHVTMDSNDAIETAHAFPQAKIVAIHNEGWGHFTESQADLAQAFSVLGLTSRLLLLERGKTSALTI